MHPPNRFSFQMSSPTITVIQLAWMDIFIIIMNLKGLSSSFGMFDSAVAYLERLTPPSTPAPRSEP